ncbi:hypothetical protein NP493_471g02054 [Ridgeia piscesae]|uniref:SOCS box domain-containing protein n=1 Tax=Ridgeia piscesae TaxID=27915 RepID=A0AAD9KZL0_RIDPI|nr:hypothetical protein NP493_471g02054 [Ridgeia piscesae]
MCSAVVKANAHDLHQAVLSGGVDNVRELLDLNTITINSTVCGATALSLALYKEQMLAFELILFHRCTKHQLDLNKLSKDEKQRVEPPLVTTCRLGNEDAVRMLVARGADLEATDNFRHTALWMATRQRHTDLARFLVDSGACVNPSMMWTHSPLYFAVKYSSKRTQIAKLLIQNGGNVNIHNGPSLLFCAIVQGSIDVAKLIVAAGYHVSKDGNIRTEFNAGTLTRNANLIAWLREELSCPVSLQRQCRSAIRQTIRETPQGNNYFLRKLGKLPLPPGIIDYLTLYDEVNLGSATR